MIKFIVITTINATSEAITKFSQYKDWMLILVGDKKTPKLKCEENNIRALDVDWQETSGYHFTKKCPYNHYSRKNIGYIFSIKYGAEQLLDTDDDNFPYADWYRVYDDIAMNNYDVISKAKFVNIYSLFTDKHIWPRGFPLTKILNSPGFKIIKNSKEEIGIIQSLADGNPDVDAIYRLTNGEHTIFKKRSPVILDKNVYCPFNSQNTLWVKDVFTYLYLPISVSFRFTDILRGYVAQRGIWELNKRLAFTHASVYQERNIHNLLEDFTDEIQCYLNAEKLIDILDNISLRGNANDDIIEIYLQLMRNNIVTQKEIESLECWLKDVSC